MLGKVLDNTKWFSLLLLTVGVIFVQVQSHISHMHSVLLFTQLPTGEGVTHAKGNRFVGLIAVLSACCSSGKLHAIAGIDSHLTMLTSGFAGVYFERILKNTSFVT